MKSTIQTGVSIVIQPWVVAIARFHDRRTRRVALRSKQRITPVKPGGIMGERMSCATGRRSGADDPLLGCLLLINRAMERPVSSLALREKGALDGMNLTLPLLGVTAAHFGLSTRLVDCSLDRISDTMLPAILLLDQNKPCVLLRRCEYGRLIIALPGWGGGVQEVDHDELLAHYSGHAVLAQPASRLDSTAETVIPQPCPSGVAPQPAWLRHGRGLLASTFKGLCLAGSRLKMWPPLLASTVRCLGIEVDDALEMAEKTEA